MSEPQGETVMNRTNAAVSKKLPRSTSPAPVWALSTAFTNEITLPAQFFLLPQHSTAYGTGTRRLMLAVLEDAVACWFRYCDVHTTRSRRLFRETRDWFWSHGQSWLYAFESICTHLELDPDYIRRGLLHARPQCSDQYGSVVQRQPVPSSRPYSAPEKSLQGGMHRAQHRRNPGQYGVAR
jgi:hypothetical protein